MQIVLLGDVGVLDDMVHIGDEAMFEEFVTQLRLRGVTSITGLSSNPAETTARYGITAIANVGFGPAITPTRAEQVARLEQVLAAAAGAGAAAGAAALDPADPAWAVIEAVRAADGVAVSGGGNMASIWPLHIFERAALARLAALFGKPFVVSGQTIGPVLVGDDRPLVASLLSSAGLVGLRESASLALVGSLGVADAVGTIDDASFLGAASPPAASPPAASPPAGAERQENAASSPSGRPSVATRAPDERYCAVTLAAHVGELDRDEFAAEMARLLDEVAATTGLEIVFFAHFASLRGASDERGDSLAHRRVIDRMTTPSRIEPTTDSLAAAAFSRGASLAITSRYHPAIFAVSAGVPTVGIAVDDYTTVKLTGALGNFGQSGVVTAASVVDDTALAQVLTTWRSAETIRAAWSARLESTRATSDAWWDRVVTLLTGATA